MSKSVRLKSLAINGGEKSIKCLLPDRSLLGEEEKAAINSLFDGAISEGAAIGYNGPEEEQYTKEFAEFMGGGYADAVNSGTTAVFVALKALNIEPFTEVIVSPITDPGGIMPIPMLNCIPVVADAAAGKYNTDAKEIEKYITPLTSAIVVAHIGGEPADIENIVALGKKHGIPVVEDCAQAHGAKLNGKLVGTFGDIAAISTMFGKHHSTGGQGGIVYTQREDLYWKIRQAADRGKPFGISNPNGNVMASLNFNLDEIGATIGRQQLKKLPEIVKRRRDVVERLKREFSKLDAIIIPEQLEGSEPSYWWWRLDVDEGKLNVTKREYCEALLAEGVPLNPSYSAALPQLFDWYKKRRVFGTSEYPWSAPEYKGDKDKIYSWPNAIEATKRQFNLTIYESWEDEEIELIVSAFKKVEDAYRK